MPALAAAWGALLGALLYVFAYRAAPDDALITLAFARNLVDQGCWCITTGLEVNTATNPLLVGLYAAGYAVIGHALWVAGGVLVACYAACGWWLYRLGGPIAAVLGPLLFASSPILTASVGMETIVAVTVLLGAVYATTSRRWVWVAACVAAAPVTRPDLAVGVVAAVAVAAFVARTVRPAIVAVLAGGVLIAPWYLFSWWHFGSLWPDTLPVKAAQAGWGDGTVHLANSLPLLMNQSPTPIWITVLTLVGGLVAVALAVERRQWATVAVAAGGVAEFAALCTSATTPIIYYPGILVGAMACALALAAGRVRWLIVWPAAAILLGLVFSTHHYDHIRAGYHPLRQNWATNAQYEQIVNQLPVGAVTYSPGEIGAFAFYCLDRGCRVVDPFLADPGRVSHAVETWKAEHPALRWNYRHHAVSEPVPAQWQVDFTYPGRPEQPGDVGTVGGMWNYGAARVTPGSPSP